MKTVSLLIDLFISIVIFFIGFLFIKIKFFNKKVAKSASKKSLFIYDWEIGPISISEDVNIDVNEYVQDIFKRGLSHYCVDRTLIVYPFSDGTSKSKRLTKGVQNLELAAFEGAKKVPDQLVCVRRVVTLLRNIYVLAEISLRFKADYIEVYSFSRSSIIAYWLKKVIGVKVLCQVMGNYHWQVRSQRALSPTARPLDRVALFIDKLRHSIILRSFDGLLAFSDNIAESLRPLGVVDNKIYRTRITSDPIIEHLVLDGGDGVSSGFDFPFFVTWARLEGSKYAEDGLQAALLVLSKVPDVKYVMIGEGSLRPALEEMANNHPEGHRVIFTGNLPRQQALSIAQKALVALHPLSGFSLLEAGYLKLATVAYKIEWCNEIIVDNYSGKLSEFRQPEKLADDICFLLEHQEIAKEMGERLYDIVASRHDASYVIKDREAKIMQFLESKPTY